MIKTQEHIAHLERQLQDLSDVIAQQADQITQLTRRVEMLMNREAEREAAGEGAVMFGDERPPHY